MSKTQNTEVIEELNSPSVNRRTFLKGVTVGMVGLAYGSTHGTQNAKAIAPAVWAGGIAASAAVGWAVREFEVLGSDSPPEGLTADALQDRIYQTARTRKSTMESTFVDNRNLLQNSEQIAYADGKIAAIEKLNEGLSQSEVQDAAIEASDNHYSTLQENLIKSWNEAVHEWDNMAQAVLDHPDLTYEDSFLYYPGGDSTSSTWSYGTEVVSYQLENGNNVDVHEIDAINENGADQSIKLEDSESSFRIQDDIGDLETFYYPRASLDDDDFNPDSETDFSYMWKEMQNTASNVRNGLITWVDTVYSDVQSGELELSELITPRERAEMVADEENIAPAIADLIALNASVDPEREATITLLDENVTLEGTFARTANPDGEPLQTGETYDPETLTGDVYFTYDVSQGQGVWNEYETAVDGGEVTFTSEPYESVNYVIDTTAGESATVTVEDFTDKGDGTFTVDISSQVETTITEVDSVQMLPDSSETQYETVILNQQFTIEKFEDSDGNEVDEASFEESSEPQTDDNYITQEEWDELETRNEELIDAYEESQEDDGSGIAAPDGLTDNFFFDRYFGIPVWAYGSASAAVAYIFGGSD